MALERKIMYQWTKEEVEALQWMVDKGFSLETLDNVLEDQTKLGILGKLDRTRGRQTKYWAQYRKFKSKTKSYYWTEEEVEALKWMVDHDCSLEAMKHVFDRTYLGMENKIRRMWPEKSNKYSRERHRLNPNNNKRTEQGIKRIKDACDELGIKRFYGIAKEVYLLLRENFPAIQRTTAVSIYYACHTDNLSTKELKRIELMLESKTNTSRKYMRRKKYELDKVIFKP